MLLRESGRQADQAFDLTAITDPNRSAGVPHEGSLRSLAEQTIAGEWEALASTLEAASTEMGRSQAVAALVVASAFNGITRVADATGIPLDDNTARSTVTMRDRVGLNTFDYAEKTARYG